MKDNIFKYNYVIFGSTGFYLIGYQDIIKLSNVRYFSSIRDNIRSKFTLLLQRLTFSKFVNHYINEPFSTYTFSHMLNFNFVDDRPICFLFFGNTTYLYNSSYLLYLTKKYPDCKKVLYLQDIVQRHRYLSIDKCKKVFDLVLSYDHGDCHRYDLFYWPTPYSYYPIVQNNSLKSDVFYCGNAKMRYNAIIEVYKKCTSQGLRCLFYIVGAPTENRYLGEGLIYDKYISYVDNLRCVAQSKCVLEIMQDNADGFTPRVWESIMYDKHLLTDNDTLKKSNFYRPLNMHDINGDLENISTWINQASDYDQLLKDSLSPIHLLKQIERLLS